MIMSGIEYSVDALFVASRMTTWVKFKILQGKVRSLSLTVIGASNDVFTFTTCKNFPVNGMQDSACESHDVSQG